jgi:hypothetical protein
MSFEHYENAPHVPQFQAIVTKHMMESIAPEEWRLFRFIARTRSNIMLDDDMPGIDTPAELAAHAVCEAFKEDGGLPMWESVAIGEIDGQPVVYYVGRGIYRWVPKGNGHSYLELWVTSPAYPPGW